MHGACTNPESNFRVFFLVLTAKRALTTAVTGLVIVRPTVSTLPLHEPSGRLFLCLSATRVHTCLSGEEHGHHGSQTHGSPPFTTQQGDRWRLLTEHTPLPESCVHSRGGSHHSGERSGVPVSRITAEGEL